MKIIKFELHSNTTKQVMSTINSLYKTSQQSNDYYQPFNPHHLKEASTAINTNLLWWSSAFNVKLIHTRTARLTFQSTTRWRRELSSGRNIWHNHCYSVWCNERLYYNFFQSTQTTLLLIRIGIDGLLPLLKHNVLGLHNVLAQKFPQIENYLFSFVLAVTDLLVQIFFLIISNHHTDLALRTEYSRLEFLRPARQKLCSKFDSIKLVLGTFAFFWKLGTRSFKILTSASHDCTVSARAVVISWIFYASWRTSFSRITFLAKAFSKARFLKTFLSSSEYVYDSSFFRLAAESGKSLHFPPHTTSAARPSELFCPRPGGMKDLCSKPAAPGRVFGDPSSGRFPQQSLKH